MTTLGIFLFFFFLHFQSFCFNIILNIQKSYKNETEFFCPLYPESAAVINIFCACFMIIRFLQVFQTHLRVGFICHTPFPFMYFNVYFLKVRIFSYVNAVHLLSVILLSTLIYIPLQICQLT